MLNIKLLSQLAQASIDLDNQVMESRKKIARSAIEAEGDMAEAASAFAKDMISKFNNKTNKFKSEIASLRELKKEMELAGEDISEVDQTIKAYLQEWKKLALKGVSSPDPTNQTP